MGSTMTVYRSADSVPVQVKSEGLCVSLAGGLELAEEVLDGGEGVVKEHTWTGPAHHRLNAGFHIGSVAVYRAFAAGGLRRTIATAL